MSKDLVLQRQNIIDKNLWEKIGISSKIGQDQVTLVALYLVLCLF